MITKIPNDAEAAAVIAALVGPYHLWINGSEVVIYTGDDLPPTPAPLSDEQVRTALVALVEPGATATKSDSVFKVVKA